MNYRHVTSLAALMLSASMTWADSLGTAFTYQGRLVDNGQPANGLYDVRFALWDAVTNGSALGGVLTNAATPVSDGLFTAVLDFGSGMFAGGARWLEISVRTNGAPAAFTSLSPRQAVMPAPYALHASSAASAASADTATSAGTASVAPWSGLTGVPSGFKDGVDNDTTYSAGVGLVLGGSVLSLDTKFTDSRYWKLEGNTGTTSAHFLGTTDSQPVELRVNNRRLLRLELPTGAGPNIIAGDESNEIAAGITNATIGGGSRNFIEARGATVGGGVHNLIFSNAWSATISGGLNHTISRDAYEGTIGGGQANSIQTSANSATIGGGNNNSIRANAEHATIGGGYVNVIQQDATDATIGGGRDNTIQTNAYRSTIAGGYDNNIYAGANHSTIAGGYRNSIDAQASGSTVGGGNRNQIKAGAQDSTIAGGTNHIIEAGAFGSTIGGGQTHVIQFQSEYASIGGGLGNVIETNSWGGTIGGGIGNLIKTNGSCGTIGGGRYNEIGGGASSATIAGGIANMVETNADYAAISGGTGARARAHGQWAHSAGSFGGVGAGDAQASLYVMRRFTTNAEPAELFLDSRGQRLTIPMQATWAFQILVVARTANGISAGYEFKGCVENYAGNVLPVGPFTKTVLGENDVTWDAVVAADNANNALTITVTGYDGVSPVRWVATVHTAEVKY